VSRAVRRARRSPRAGVFAIAIAGMGAMALAGTGTACAPAVDAKVIGTARPPLPEDCPVKGFITIAPTYPVEPIASARVACRGTFGADCRDKLKREACKLGGDTIYDVHESADGFTATIGAKK
jgi:hypothetical protein